MSVIDEIAAERQRQIEKEGWTPEHDDRHEDGVLGQAGAVYAHIASIEQYEGWRTNPDRKPPFWPWDLQWWKPKNRRRDLVRAAALIVAEIERLDRSEIKGSTPAAQDCSGIDNKEAG